MTKLDPAVVETLVRGELKDPHTILGVHDTKKGSVIHAWRPEATSVEVRVGGELTAKLDQIHPAGFFEGIIDGSVDDYQLEVTYPDGGTFPIRDPYAFMPTLGELDLHLVGEGRHTRIWEKLGAHVRSERDQRSQLRSMGSER